MTRLTVAMFLTATQAGRGVAQSDYRLTLTTFIMRVGSNPALSRQI